MSESERPPVDPLTRGPVDLPHQCPYCLRLHMPAASPAAPRPEGLDTERLAVIGAARRFLAAHDRMIGSEVVTRDDTFAMKNTADDLRDVLAFYDEAARLSDTGDTES